MSEAKSHTITFQSFEEVNTKREFRDQLWQVMSTHSIAQWPYMTHSTLVMPLTWPSSQRTAARVSRSHMAAEPSLRPATTKRPERSNLASEHWEGREAWTAVGYMILKGSALDVLRDAQEVDVNGRQT
jgi:hypothetical protein